MKESSCDHFLEAEKELLMKLRPNAIPLVDALDYGDESLQSCIGCYDGEVYERLLQAARQSRLNKNKVQLLCDPKLFFLINCFLGSFKVF